MIATTIGTSLLAVTLLCAPLLVDDDRVAATQRPFYPLQTCVVSGEPLVVVESNAETGPIEVVIEQRLYRLCCSDCVKTLRAAPARYAARLDEAVAQAQLPDYPLTTCPLSDEELPAAPQLVVIESRLVKLCCTMCLHSLRIDPGPAFAALDVAAIAAQTADYPLQTCPISGKPLGDQPRNVLSGTQLVRLCCGSCVRKFAAAPEAALAAVRAALPVSEGEGPTKPVKHGPIQGLKPIDPDDPLAPRGRGGR